MFRNAILGALALALLAGPARAGDIDRTNAPERKALQVLDDVTVQVRQYTRFTIFDDVNVAIDNGVVRLTGKVTAPFKKDDIAARVARVAGVQQVQNDLAVCRCRRSTTTCGSGCCTTVPRSWPIPRSRCSISW